MSERRDIRAEWLNRLVDGVDRTYFRQFDPVSAHETGTGWDPVIAFLPGSWSSADWKFDPKGYATKNITVLPLEGDE